MNCLFCDIVSEKKSAHKIYEDKSVVAVLDVLPRAPGHTLVLPRRHAEVISELSETELGKIFFGVNQTINILSRSLAPDGFTIGINHGKAGGQAVEHLHIHIMPRFYGDNGGSLHSVVDNIPGGSLEEMYRKIVPSA